VIPNLAAAPSTSDAGIVPTAETGAKSSLAKASQNLSSSADDNQGQRLRFTKM
jgi:hypothetical protein